MKRLLILVGLLGFLLMPSVAQAITDITYCVNPMEVDDTYYRLTQDINFTNASSYPEEGCFRHPGGVLVDNVTLDLNGFTVYANSSVPIFMVTMKAMNNFTIINGTLDFSTMTNQGGAGIISFSRHDEGIYIKNVTVLGGGRAGFGLTIGSDDAKNFTIEDSTFTGAVTYDTELHLPQSEITSCGNTYNTFWGLGSLLSKDSCTDPPPSPSTYKDYIRQVNCTKHSSTAYGSLVCSNEIKIPADCVNITTEAWTVLTPQNETWLNESWSFTRFTCNPEGDRIEHCDNLYKTCTYYNFNAYPLRRWDDYAAGQNATSWHVVGIPPNCLVNQEGGNFSMIGRLQMSCKSFTESGIEIDGEEESCEHGMYCFNSNTMEERFVDCTSILTPCPYGCVEGVCLSVATTTLPTEAGLDTLLDLSAIAPGASWVSMLFTPFSIITMFLVGIGTYFESQVKDAKGGIFLAVIIVGVIAFSYMGIYPAWIGILIAIVCAGILSKFVMHLW